jgi:hypothetical protein
MMGSNLKARIERLAKAMNKAVVIQAKQAARPRMLDCKGMEWRELLNALDAAVPEESFEVVEDILRQMEEYHARPPRELHNGEQVHELHGFYRWLHALRLGWGKLPERIPPVVLLAWRNGHRDHPAHATPVPHIRCQDCLMLLPNCTPEGFGGSVNPCPICRSDQLFYMNLWAPGTWGPKHRGRIHGH